MRSSSRRIRLSLKDRHLLGHLRSELGVEVTQLLRLGLRALVCLGVSPDERSSLKGKMTTVRPNSADALIVARFRKELRGASNSDIYRMALHALARKEELARVGMSKERLERGVGPALVPRKRPLAAPDYVSLEPKACEGGCGKSFLRVIGEEDKVCATCEERLAAAQRDCAASLAAARLDPDGSAKRRAYRYA